MLLASLAVLCCGVCSVVELGLLFAVLFLGLLFCFLLNFESSFDWSVVCCVWL